MACKHLQSLRAGELHGECGVQPRIPYVGAVQPRHPPQDALCAGLGRQRAGV